MRRFIPFFIILLALIACTVPQVQKPEPTATSNPPVNMPNPASVYCVQHDNKLEILTAADGSQSGVCVFPDGSTCGEWAYYSGECGSKVPTIPTPTTTVEITIEATGNPVENGSGEYMPPGTSEELSDWWGVIKSTEPGAQYDDYFERRDLGQNLYFGIDSMDPAVKSQIEALRDSGKIVHLYGTLGSNVPDYNGSQIQVDRIEIQE
jgi:putative hemolysin